MHNISIDESTHSFVKNNLVGVTDKKGVHDVLTCQRCGISGKSYQLGILQISGKYSEKNAFFCVKRIDNIPKTIIVILCTAHGKAFENITPNSKHVVITPPKGHLNDHTGVWVMGTGEPVKVLTSEYKRE